MLRLVFLSSLIGSALGFEEGGISNFFKPNPTSNANAASYNTHFRIRSTNANLCLHAESETNGSMIVVQICDENSDLQKWRGDQYGRLFSKAANNRCIFRAGFNLKLKNCGNPNKLNTFVFDIFDSTIIWKKKGNLAFSIQGDTPVAGRNVQLLNRVHNKDFQQWSPVPDTPTATFVGNPCSSGDSKCTLCTGDCDEDSDCEGNLRCAQRYSGQENVPGCGWGETSDDEKLEGHDYCFAPVSLLGIVNYVGECQLDGFLCKECEGDCDSDSDCEGDLVCMERSGYESVPGCVGVGGGNDMHAKDICFRDPSSGEFRNSLQISNDGCSAGSPCEKCTGSCMSDSDCGSGLHCFDRNGVSPVPGCVTGGSGDISDTNYCYERPTNGDYTYIPGELSVEENGLKLSTGLTSRIIARTGEPVSYVGGGSSSIDFHSWPDGAAIFEVTEGSNTGGYIYVSNSEEYKEDGGGVGAITFNADGEVIDYRMIVTGTDVNCGGGKTYWNTWVTCEENEPTGQVHEVDPFIGISSQRQTVIGGNGGDYESFAYEARDRMNPTFYVTNDDSEGGLVRFTPDPDVVAEAEATGDYSAMLTTMGTLHWLVLQPSSDPSSGTFRWTSDRSEGDTNAYENYRNSEGIDIRDGKMYFTTKVNKYLFILDLDFGTYERSSTVSGAFNGQPDQIKRIIFNDPLNDMLYFCEDGGNDHGVHARDTDGNFYTIIDSVTLNSETTGLAFSPDNKHMYVSFQQDGIIFDITREDGYRFGAHRLDIKYHDN